MTKLTFTLNLNEEENISFLIDLGIEINVTETHIYLAEFKLNLGEQYGIFY